MFHIASSFIRNKKCAKRSYRAQNKLRKKALAYIEETEHKKKKKRQIYGRKTECLISVQKVLSRNIIMDLCFL